MKNLVILSFLFISFISLEAFADTIYIRIPILAESKYTKEDFATDYKATTGEGWVMNNMREEKSEMMMMGSSRLTEAQAIELKERWPMINYHKQITDEYPDGWNPKTVEYFE